MFSEKKRLQRLDKSWEILTDTIPGFREEMISLGGNVKLRKKVCKEVSRGTCRYMLTLPSHPDPKRA
jgi:hypothetical protein